MWSYNNGNGDLEIYKKIGSLLDYVNYIRGNYDPLQ